MATNPEKVVVITGCSTGIGLAIAVCLAKNQGHKFHVYATMRNLEKKTALVEAAGDSLDKTLFIRQLDVCSDEHVNKVVDEIVAKEGKLDVIVNNAGMGLFGPIEICSMEKIKNITDINLFGVIRLTKKVIPIMKKQQSGHLIMVSSVGGIIGYPLNSIYCATKFGIEGFSESIAVECTKYNIKVSVVEPGPVLSNFRDNVKQHNLPSEEDMEKLDDMTKKLVQTSLEKTASIFTAMGQTSEDIAGVVLEAITSPTPQFRYLTNKLYTSAVSQKYTDLTGNSTIEHVRKMLMSDDK